MSIIYSSLYLCFVAAALLAALAFALLSATDPNGLVPLPACPSREACALLSLCVPSSPSSSPIISGTPPSNPVMINPPTLVGEVPPVVNFLSKH